MHDGIFIQLRSFIAAPFDGIARRGVLAYLSLPAIDAIEKYELSR
jgi:hypothetical protein